MRTIDFACRAAVIGPVLLLSQLSVAGQEPPIFSWLTATDGDWTDPSRWDQNAVPGLGSFLNADVFINAPGPMFSVTLPPTPEPLAVGNLTMGANAGLVIPFPALDGATFRSITLLDQAFFYTQRNAFVLEDVNVASGALLQVAVRQLSVGGQFDNSGTLRLSNGELSTSSFHNLGALIATPGFDGNTIMSPGGFVNDGLIDVANNELRIEGDFLHRGALQTQDFGSLAVRGNVTIEDTATFAPGAQLRLTGDQGVHRTARGTLSDRVSVAGGAWTIEDALPSGVRFGSTSDTESLTLLQDLDAHSFVIRGGQAHLRAIAATAPSGLLAQHTIVDGAAVFHDDVELGGVVEFRDNYHFGADVTLNAATVNFHNGLSVMGNLVVSSSSVISTPDNRISASGDITWSTPSLDLNIELLAGDEAILGVRRINVAPTARRIRLGAGYSELNTDLTPERDVLIAGTSLSIGAVGEIAHRTIHGDLTTTYAPSQGWDFDILGSGARGAEESDTLVIEGDASIYGILRVHTIGDASALRAGDEFTLFTAESIDALFRFVSLPTLADGMSFDLVYESSESSVIRLVVVPAPGAALALGIAGLAPIARRRRRPRSRRWLLAES